MPVRLALLWAAQWAPGEYCLEAAANHPCLAVVRVGCLHPAEAMAAWAEAVARHWVQGRVAQLALEPVPTGTALVGTVAAVAMATCSMWVARSAQPKLVQGQERELVGMAVAREPEVAQAPGLEPERH